MPKKGRRADAAKKREAAKPQQTMAERQAPLPTLETPACNVQTSKIKGGCADATRTTNCEKLLDKLDRLNTCNVQIATNQANGDVMTKGKTVNYEKAHQPISERQQFAVLMERQKTCIVQGSTHQGNTVLFQNAGLQCSYIALVSLLRMSFNDPGSWCISDIDEVLVTGDTMFSQHFKEKQTTPRMLAAKELPHKINVFCRHFCIKTGCGMAGIISDIHNDTIALSAGVGYTLDSAVCKLFTKFKYALFLCCSQIVAIASCKNRYYIFDSHSRDDQGLQADDGKTVLLEFPTQESLIDHLKILFIQSLKVKETEQFEIVPVSVQKQTSEFVHNPDVQMYFEDQTKRATVFQTNKLSHEDNVTGDRRLYMKQYMKKKRQQQYYRQKENGETRHRMKKLRTDAKFVGKETIENKKRMKIIRANPDYTEKEAKQNKITMKKLRKNPEYTEKEAKQNKKNMKTLRKSSEYTEKEAKQNKKNMKTLRKNPEYTEKEAKQNKKNMKTLRKNPEYTEKEATTNKKRIKTLRTNPEFTEKEAKQNKKTMKTLRKNPEYTEKEATTNKKRIKTLRTNPEFTEKEAKQNKKNMKALRKNPDYTEKEATTNKKRIKTLRTNPEFTEKEAKQNKKTMKKLRKNPVYKEKEAKQKKKHMKTLRKNPKYTGKEAAKNKKRMESIRANEDYSKEERSKNYEKLQHLRSDPVYSKDERKRDARRKKRKRDDDDFKEHERLVKQQKRRDTRVKERENRACALARKQKRKNQMYLENEAKRRCERKNGSSSDTYIEVFENSIGQSCTYVCSCCHQLWFKESVKETQTLVAKSGDSVSKYLTGKLSVEKKEWVCNSCSCIIQKGNIPKLAVNNGMAFVEKPPELDLTNLEERLIALRIPFMQIRSLASGGQYQLRGSVVNVPAQIEPTIRALPRNVDESGIIPVRLKRMLKMKNADQTENVRPAAVHAALKTLLETSDLYKDSEVNIDINWTETGFTKDESVDCDESCDGNSSDNFSEVDECESNEVITLLDEPEEKKNTVVSVAPGEGQKPISLYKDPDAEYLAFPTIFCGKRRVPNSERKTKVYYSDICKWELRSCDRRVALHVPNIFFKMKKLQCQQVCNKVNLAIRRCKTQGKSYTAGYILKDNMGDSLVKLDEGYRIFRSIRNSPQYWEWKRKEIFAMIRQLGIPTLFLSLSANDLHWPELIKALGILIDDKDYSGDIQKKTLTWETRTRLVRSDPVTCVRHFDHRVRQYLNILKGPYSPVGMMTDFFYRVEFQQRGSPHIHLLGWIDGAPVYNGKNEKEVCEFIDNIASCSADVSENEKPFLEFQMHRHSRTCRKRGSPVCRFGVPFPPMRNTRIIQPYDGTDKQKYQDIYKEIQKALNGLEEDTAFEIFLEILGLTEEEYIRAVSTSVKAAKIFLKRKPSESRINPYMKGQLSVWRANHDIQFVLDAYACAVYIVDYISKSAKGMSRLMAETCKEAKKGNQTLRESVRHIGNTFLNAAEVSAQEAAYLILQLSMSNKSRQCIFIPTAPQSERTFLLKTKKDLEQLPEDSTDIESDNVMKRYARRHDALEKFSLADFVSKFVSLTRLGSETNREESDTEEKEPTNNDSESDSETDRVFTSFHHVVKHGMKIKLRSKPRIIRYVRYNEKDDQENFYREQLLLFKPWRRETEDLLAGHNSYMEHYMSVKAEVERKRNEYEQNADMLKEVEAELNACQAENFDEIMPNIESVEANDAEEPVEPAKPFSFYMPDKHEHRHYDLGADLGVATHIPSDQVEMLQGRLQEQEYFMLLKSLNEKQREIFNHIMHSLNYKENELLRIFITGGAGVGKSVVIRVLYQALHRHYCSQAGQNPEDVRIAVCAYTGLAAYNVQGSTLHSAFAIEPNKRLEYKQLTDEKRNTLQVKYRHLSVVIIDEISMLGNDMLKFLYHRLQEIKHNYVEPFGGVHMILVGDLFQLRPVGDGWIFEDYKRGYNVLAPNLWKSYFKMFELNEIMRQKDDKNFAELLNRLREGKQTDKDLKELERCTVTKASEGYKQLHAATHLFATNKDVDNHNAQIFEATQTEKAVISCIDTVKGDCSSDVKEKILSSVQYAKTDKTSSLMNTLKVATGLTYESSHNVLQEDGICNGSPCVLKKIQYLDPNSSTPSVLWVKFNDDTTGRQTRTTYKRYYVHGIEKDWTPIWAIKRTFMYSGKAVVRQQFPLKPAAAKTVHKAQGQTKSEVVVDLSAAHAHHHYVAYSRVTSISGLHLLNGIGSKIKVDERVVSEVERLRSTGQIKLSYRPIYSFENCFKVVFQNIQSMPAHFDLICCDRNFTSSDIIALAETNLKISHEDGDFVIKGFHQVIRCDQSLSTSMRVCHGLAIYIKSTHEILSTDYISTSQFECLNINLKSESDVCLSVLVIYSKPGCSLTAFKNNMNKTAKFSLFKNLVVVGDFNFDISDSQNQAFLHVMKDCFPATIQIVKTPTTKKKTILDLCFTSYSSAFYEVITCLWSYHNTLGILIPFQV